jgi:hypothetical protein
MGDVLIDGGDKFGHAGEHASAQPLGGDIAEEALNHIQPRRGGGREVHVEARMLDQPSLYGRMLVRGVVVRDQMERLVLGRFAIDLAQELQPLDLGVALLALTDDLPVQHVERGKQRARAIALIVVRHGGTPLL